MFNHSDIKLEKLIVHKVGNKLQGEKLILSGNPIMIDDEDTRDLLLHYFFKPFKTEEFYSFFHEEGLNANIVYKAISEIFFDINSFHQQSKILATHLYNNSNHPNIKSGEFYIVLLRDCLLGGELVDGVGLFKSENKDTYLKVYQKNETYDIEHERGININRLDKGCLILNTNRDDGFRVAIVDKTNAGQETAHYWKDDFLMLTPIADNFYHTQNYLNMCKGFVEDVFNPENEVDRADQIVMLNKSMDYFNKKDHFDEFEFQQEVMQQPEIINAFNNYKQSYEQKTETDPTNGFEISKSACKANKRYFRSILKLDKNFHVYIHGNREFVEKGFDDKRHMSFYKLYFFEES